MSAFLQRKVSFDDIFSRLLTQLDGSPGLD